MLNQKPPLRSEGSGCSPSPCDVSDVIVAPITCDVIDETSVEELKLPIDCQFKEALIKSFLRCDLIHFPAYGNRERLFILIVIKIKKKNQSYNEFILSFCLSTGHLLVVLEIAENGSLLDFLKKSRGTDENYDNINKFSGGLSEEMKLRIATDVAKGMAHLASCRVGIIAISTTTTITITITVAITITATIIVAIITITITVAITITTTIIVAIITITVTIAITTIAIAIVTTTTTTILLEFSSPYKIGVFDFSPAGCSISHSTKYRVDNASKLAGKLYGKTFCSTG